MITIIPADSSFYIEFHPFGKIKFYRYCDDYKAVSREIERFFEWMESFGMDDELVEQINNTSYGIWRKGINQFETTQGEKYTLMICEYDTDFQFTKEEWNEFIAWAKSLRN